MLFHALHENYSRATYPIIYSIIGQHNMNTTKRELSHVVIPLQSLQHVDEYSVISLPQFKRSALWPVRNKDFPILNSICTSLLTGERFVDREVQPAVTPICFTQYSDEVLPD